MLDALRLIAVSRFPDILQDPSIKWQTLDILYEEPRVERAWTTIDEYRLYIHRIHPCEKPFFHPHAWPSAVLSIEGKSIVQIGNHSRVLGTFQLVEGCGYEMLDPEGWHSVNPIAQPTLSLMLSAKPFESMTVTMSESARKKNHPLSPTDFESLMYQFKQAFGIVP